MAQTGRAADDLTQVMDVLKRTLTALPVPTEPLQMILWENIGYLADDPRRRDLFDTFETTVGLDPAAILGADEAMLLTLARRGGMRPDTRVERWREIARIVLSLCYSDLNRTLRPLPLAKARTLLKIFPVTADPGADKILLFSGIAVRPSLESNGLRALARLGFLKEQSSHNRSYRAGIEVLVEGGRPDQEWLFDAHVLLRELGKTTCRRGEPLCAACPVDPICAHATVSVL